MGRQAVTAARSNVIAGQLTAAGSHSTKQLCCVHYRMRLVAVAALQDSRVAVTPASSSGSVLQLTLCASSLTAQVSATALADVDTA